MLLPSACAISSQLLPEAALLFDQETWLQNAAAALSPLCREVLNAYPLLEENGDSRLFYRTDSRPTQLTGYLLYQRWARRWITSPMQRTALAIRRCGMTAPATCMPAGATIRSGRMW